MDPLYSIGHSTRSLEEFLRLLKINGITRLADIRRYPGSRRYPHFSAEALSRSLPDHGIHYIHLPSLGGRRKPLPDSPNRGMRNEQFRGYADHMTTDEFRQGVEELLATDRRTAFMCAEAVPWRCHRNLLADDLTRRGITVVHIVDGMTTQKHVMSAHGRVVGDRVLYEEEQGTMFDR
jgi:uncharacterized protein (DUF488 family)